MKSRFEGEEGSRRLANALQAQKVCSGDQTIGAALAGVVGLHELQPAQPLITEGASDNDLYFIIAGSFSIFVKGIKVATRGVSDCVGEMAAVNPSLPRSATVVANETSVVAKISEKDFVRIADVHPALWRNIAAELASRLLQRNSLVVKPNEKPKLFVISSKEALPIAREIQSILQHDLLVQVWTDGVFFASSYALEALEQAVAESDFAIAIAQADDVSTSREKESKIARDNVIFELGLFMGRLGRRRSILFQPSGQELKLPSDLQGLTAVSYSMGNPKDLVSLLGPACNEVRKLVQEFGVRK
jgi:CRP/FNR family transcriptional regulator, cyclic AMP receptor protein